MRPWEAIRVQEVVLLLGLLVGASIILFVINFVTYIVQFCSAS